MGYAKSHAAKLPNFAAQLSFMRYLFGCLTIWIGLMACSPNNVKENPALGKLLEEENMSGVVGIFHNLAGDFVLSDRKWFRDSAAMPGASFHTVLTLIGVETGRIMDSSATLNGITLNQAFRGDSLSFFQELARRVGQDTLQSWLDTLGYARRYDTPRIAKLDSFWIDNSFRVTADEQLGVVKRLYFDQLPFQRRTHAIVSDMMVQSVSQDIKVAYHISENQEPNGSRIVWVQGWREKEKHPDFFVIQLRSEDPQADMKAAAARIIDRILAGFLP
jgi:hypothetical protein